MDICFLSVLKYVCSNLSRTDKKWLTVYEIWTLKAFLSFYTYLFITLFKWALILKRTVRNDIFRDILNRENCFSKYNFLSWSHFLIRFLYSTISQVWSSCPQTLVTEASFLMQQECSYWYFVECCLITIGQQIMNTLGFVTIFEQKGLYFVYKTNTTLKYFS